MNKKLIKAIQKVKINFPILVMIALCFILAVYAQVFGLYILSFVSAGSLTYCILEGSRLYIPKNGNISSNLDTAKIKMHTRNLLTLIIFIIVGFYLGVTASLIIASIIIGYNIGKNKNKNISIFSTLDIEE